MPKVLYVVHNHPAVMPGGAETYALELYEAMRDSGRYDPLLLARTGPPVSRSGRVHEGTLLEPVGGDPSQYFFHTDIADYDWFLSTSRNKDVYTKFYREFLHRLPARRRALPAHAVPRLRHPARDPANAARRRRSSTRSTSTSRSATATGRCCTTGGERCTGASPATVPRLLPGDPPAAVLPARSASSSRTSASSTGSSSPSRFLRRALRRVGHPARADHASRRTAAGRSPLYPTRSIRRRHDRSGKRRARRPEPHRLLRPVHRRSRAPTCS